MIFNSIDFAFFFIIFFILYWFVFNKNLRHQNILIVVASYIFYGWWDYRFLFLIAFSTVLDYFVGRGMDMVSNPSKRKLLLAASLVVNFGLLAYFKYYNFFIQSFIDSYTFLGYNFSFQTLSVILPVGISFYTFQTVSYTIDVYNRKLEPTKDIVVFFAYVTYFPQLVAGPIERATHLLPQFYKKKEFDYNNSIDGLRQILWGLFKKIVIADNAAEYVNIIFNNHTEYNGITLFIGAILFAFQIYGDFSGYSDIAIGTSKIFGIQLMQNFAFPYFSRDIAEFWRRWHISLTTWFRDYVYFPLGGSRGSMWLKIRNTLIVFLLSGLWHGANWTFIVWGFLNALYFIPLLILNKNRNNLGIVAQGRMLPTGKDVFNILITFILTVFSWIFFRSDNITMAFSIIGEILSTSFFNKPQLLPWSCFTLIVFFLIVEWLGREKSHALENVGIYWPKVYRHSFYYFIIFLIFVFTGKEQQFIYFQF